jgi:ubiquinone/menaquinone biosynthesis C-methylase UbiE/uncharacterized protein YbaR (Trm112 family)
LILSDKKLISILRCPECYNDHLTLKNTTTIFCKNCGIAFYKKNGVWSLLKITDKSQEDIKKFWGDLYRQLYEKQDSQLTHARLYYLLNELQRYEKANAHPVGNEISLKDLAGKDVIEIGCGAGAHSSLFKKAGANQVSVDIVPERVLSTYQKLNLIKEGSGIAMQANAERLPFVDNIFDLVYSFGVLHHTTNTQTAVEEVFRLVKPGGHAVIMLYSKLSTYYLINYLLWHGLVKGNILKGKDWLGRVTEGTPMYGDTHNPFTRAYSKQELLKMFDKFDSVSIRKGAFTFSQIPKLGSIINTWLIRKKICPTSDAGYLVWDRPLRLSTSAELYLGRLIGFGYYISCRKRF